MRQEDRDRIRIADWLTHVGRDLLDSNDGDAGRGLRLEPWQNAVLEEQRALRIRSRRRFPDPEQWLWTDRSLAQASDWWTASFKARLFPSDRMVVDACCGAGADLVALAKNNLVVGIDHDEVLIRLAANNLRSHNLTGQTTCKTFDSDLLDGSSALHIDPDRRPAGRRTTVADDFSPPIDDILRAAQRCHATIVKLAPRTRFSEDCLMDLQKNSLRVWVGNLGECRQQLALFGASQDLARSIIACDADQRIALLAEPNQMQLPGGHGSATHSTLTSFAASADSHITTSDDVAGCVHELHSVLHAANLHAAWAEQAGLRAVSSSQGYFTSESTLKSPWVQSFEVVDIVAWDDRKVRKALRALNVGIVEVKNRLIRLDANRFQTRYSSPEGVPRTLLVTRIGARVKAIIAKRV